MKRLVCSSLAIFLGPVVASAQPPQSETVLWKELPGWTVRMDPSMGNACYVSSIYEDGTVVRLGFNFLNNVRQLYFSIGNVKWKSLEAGKEYPVKIQFDNNPPWDALASAISMDAVNHLHVNTKDADFAQEFSKKLGLRAYYAGKQIVALRLKGSSKAIDEMLNCQATVTKYIGATRTPPKQTDPFAPTPSVKAAEDPFEL